MKKFHVIHPDGKYETHDKMGLKEMQAAVGGWIEAGQLPEDVWFICNENGLAENLPMNVPVALSFGVILAGPVIMLGPDDGEGSTGVEFPEEFQEALENLCSVLHQAHLGFQYMKDNPFTIEFITPEEGDHG